MEWFRVGNEERKCIMVKGLEHFKDNFKGIADAFIIVGAAACVESFRRAKMDFRVTKGIDIVLTQKSKEKTFASQFCKYVNKGGYQLRERTDEKKGVFRFYKPQDPDFPDSLKLSTSPETTFKAIDDKDVVYIHIRDNVSNLSTALASKDYLDVLNTYKEKDDSGLFYVGQVGLLLLKAKAYLNLSTDRYDGKFVKSSDIKKHRNDVFRLSYLLSGKFKGKLSEKVQEDLKEFLKTFSEQSPEWQGIQRALTDSAFPEKSPRTILQGIKTYFGL